MLESFKETNFTRAVEQMESAHRASIEFLTKAIDAASSAVDLLIKAECKIPETPDGDKIGSLTMDLENLISAIKEQKERMQE